MASTDSGLTRMREPAKRVDALALDGPLEITYGGAVICTLTPTANGVSISGGNFLIRQINDADPDSNVAGKEGEIAYNLSDNKFHVCTVTGAAGAATWNYFNGTGYS